VGLLSLRRARRLLVPGLAVERHRRAGAAPAHAASSARRPSGRSSSRTSATTGRSTCCSRGCRPS
jgi:hypothetical protein